MRNTVAAGRSPGAGQCVHVLSCRVILSQYLQGSERWWNPLKGLGPTHVLASLQELGLKLLHLQMPPFSTWPVSPVLKAGDRVPSHHCVICSKFSLALCFNAFFFFKGLASIGGVYVKSVLSKGQKACTLNRIRLLCILCYVFVNASWVLVGMLQLSLLSACSLAFLLCEFPGFLLSHFVLHVWKCLLLQQLFYA